MGLLNDPLQALTLLGGVLALLWLMVLIRRWPNLGWVGVSAAILIASDIPQTPPLATVAGLTVYPEDALALAFVAATLPKLRKVNESTGRRTGLLVLFVALVAASLLRGIWIHGIGLAVNEARALLYLIVAIAWVLAQAQDPGFIVRIRRFVTWTGWGLVAIAGYHISTRGLGSADEFLRDDGAYLTSRPLVSSQACVLVLCGLHAIISRRRALTGWAFVVVAVICQHRSVWVALVVGLCVAVLMAAPRIRARVVAGVSVATVLGVALLTMGFAQGALNKLMHSASSTGTLNDRTFGWVTLVNQMHALGWSAILTGQPMGSSYRRINAFGAIEEYGPHNWYIIIYLRLGAIGVAVLAAILLGMSRSCIQRRDVLAATWLAVIAVYAVPYALSWYLAPFVAMVLQVVVPTAQADMTAPTVLSLAAEGSLPTGPSAPDKVGSI